MFLTGRGCVCSESVSTRPILGVGQWLAPHTEREDRVPESEIGGREVETRGGEERSPDSLVNKRRRIRCLLWAELLKRTFGVDPKECPGCGRRLKMIATIMSADLVTAILDAQGLPTEAPFIRPCREPGAL